jgi:hypothetical protein
VHSEIHGPWGQPSQFQHRGNPAKPY